MDIDGNGYYSVIIGSQEWLVKNLKTTHYRNGDSIPYVTDNGTWNSLTTGAYCNYGNDTSSVASYGRLYNWFTVNDGRNISPQGWHIVTDNDWTILVNLLGGSNIAGGKLKETGTVHWSSPNTGATNETGFTTLPGGYRSYNGSFDGIRLYGIFWTSTESNSSHAWSPGLYYNYTVKGRYADDKKHGFILRCVKDR